MGTGIGWRVATRTRFVATGGSPRSDDLRRSRRPGSCRPKGGMNDQRK